ncbi:MAG: patatin-like phospholipase family protein [Sulfurimonas sp.]
MNKDLKEVVLALSGGGARGAYHLGVLHYLDEHNIKVKAICGTSIGSIIGASYACGVSPKEQLELLKSKDVKKLFKFNWFKRSFFSIDMDAPVLKQMVPVANIEDLNIPVYITAFDLDEGKEVVFTQGDLHKTCQMSSALTPFFEPVIFKNTTYIDGGLINHIPFAPLLGSNIPIIGVNLHPFIKNSIKHTLLSYVKRTLVARMLKNIESAKKHSAYFIESPELVNYSILSLKNLDELFTLGYEAARQTLEQLDQN